MAIEWVFCLGSVGHVEIVRNMPNVPPAHTFAAYRVAAIFGDSSVSLLSRVSSRLSFFCWPGSRFGGPVAASWFCG